MKKIYSFITAALATFAMNAQTTVNLEVYVYSGAYASATATELTWTPGENDDEVVITEPATIQDGVVTFTNFLGSGKQVSIACYDDETAAIVDAPGAYVNGEFSLGSLGTLTSIYLANDNYVSLSYYDDAKDGKGLEFVTWVKGLGDKVWIDAELPDDFVPAKAPEATIDPRYKNVDFYSTDWGSVKALLYGDLLRVRFSDTDIVDFKITVDGSGKKSVTYSGVAGYHYDTVSGKNIWFYEGSDYYGVGSDNYGTYIWIYGYLYSKTNNGYVYVYLPNDDWAGIDEVDAISYTYGCTSRDYSTGTNDPWVSATTTVKTKWNLEKQRLLITDYLGSKQDLLIVYDDSSIRSVWSLSDAWNQSWIGWYDDSDENPVTIYPWFDTVNKSNSYYIYPNYSTQSLSSYGNIVLYAYSYYTDDSTRESQYEYTYIKKPTEVVSAVKDIVVAEEESEAPVEYYNLQGVRVANPQSGLYIKRQGSKATKVLVK